MTTTDAAREIGELGRVIGLLDADSDLDPTWFAEPLTKLTGLLDDPARRQALLSLLDSFLPADATGPALASGPSEQVQAHPLLPDGGIGNLYLTVEPDADGTVVLGLAGKVAGPAASPVAALEVYAPLVWAGSSVEPVLASAGHPLTVDVRVAVGWKAPAEPFGLDAIRLRLALVLPADPSRVPLSVVLENLDLGTGPVAETMLDPGDLGPEALAVLTALIRRALGSGTGAAMAEAGAIAAHLPGLLGFDAGLPALPLDQLRDDPDALRAWFVGLFGEPGVDTAGIWLGHLAGLLGASTPVTGSGTQADPWRITILAASGGTPEVAVTIFRQDDPAGSGARQLLIGGSVTAVTPAGALAADVTLVLLPLAGAAATQAFPAAQVSLRVPSSGVLLAAPTAGQDGVGVGALLAGLRWDGVRVAGLLELENVAIALPGLSATTLDLLDLSSAGALTSAAKDVIAGVLKDALGATGTTGGSSADLLLALIGLDPGAPNGLGLDLATFVTDPAAAFGAYYRELLRLAGGAGGRYLMSQLQGLLGLQAVTGSGTASDPWEAAWTLTGALSLGLTGYDDVAADGTHRWRTALRLGWSGGPVVAWWQADLLGFDLPPAGAVSGRLLGALHLHVGVQPPGAVPAGSPVTITGASGDLEWQPGQQLSVSASLSGLSVRAGSETVTLPMFTLAGAGSGGDLGLGAAVADVWALLRALATVTATRLAPTVGPAAAVLLGLSTEGAGLSGLPTLALPDAQDALSALTHPGAALRARLAALAGSVGDDGQAVLAGVLPALAPLLTGAAPAASASFTSAGGDPAVQPAEASASPADAGTGSGLAGALTGAGTRADPWTVALSAAGTAELLAWLEPDGPPAAGRVAMLTTLSGAADFGGVLAAATALRSYADHLGPALEATDLGSGGAADGLQSLAAALAAGDGIVTSAQATAPGGWSTGTTVTAAHHLLPQAPAAISQIQARLTSWGAWTGPAAVVLLAAPTFASDAWSGLLNGRAREVTTVDLRAPGVDPATVDLSTLAITRFYVIELADGDPDAQAAQLLSVTQALAALQPGVPQHLVAHSTAALAACAYAAAHAGDATAPLSGLITLACPFQPASVPALTGDGCADAVRLVDRLLPGTFPAMPLADPLDDAITHLLAVLDGYAPAAGTAAPVESPYPLDVLAAGAATVSGVTSEPYAIAAALPQAADGQLLARLKDQLRQLVLAASAHAAPTHLGVGVRFGVSEAGSGVIGDVQAGVTARVDLGRVALSSPAEEPVSAKFGVDVEARLAVPGGWLVGGPGDGSPLPARVRWARLLAHAEPGADLSVSVELRDAGYRGAGTPLAGLLDARCLPLLSAALGALGPWSMATPDGDTGGATTGSGTPQDSGDGGDNGDDARVPVWESNPVIGFLTAAGLMTADADGGVQVSADALTALAADPAGHLGSHADDLLAAAGSGLSPGPATSTTDGGPGPGDWVRPLAGFPLQVVLSPDPWRLRLLSTGGGLAAGPGTGLDLDVTFPLPGKTSGTPSATAALRFAGATVTAAGGETGLHVDLALPPWLPTLTLVPAPPAASLRATLAGPVLEAAAAGAVSAVLDAAIGTKLGTTALHVPGLATLLHDPGTALAGLFAGPGGQGLDGDRLQQLFQGVARATGLTVSADGSVSLDGTGLSLAVAAEGDAGVVATLAMAPVADGGHLSVGAQLHVDRQFHVQPSGKVGFVVPLPSAASWGGTALTGLAVQAGLDAAGRFTFAVAPQTATGALAAIELLPSFSGFGPLVNAAQTRLLPAVLDALVGALEKKGAAMLRPALALASALGVYTGYSDTSPLPTDGFAQNADALAALARDGLTGLTTPGGVADAVAKVLSVLSSSGGLPGTVGSSGGVATWSMPLPDTTGTIEVSAGWPESAGASPPLTVSLALTSVAAGPVRLGLDASVSAPPGGEPALTLDPLSVQLAADTQALLGFAFTPELTLRLADGQLAVHLKPLAGLDGTAGGLDVQLAPTLSVTGSAGDLLTGWVEPLATQLPLDHVTTDGLLTRPLWGSGPTAQQVLTQAQLVSVDAAGAVLARALPADPGVLLQRLLDALATPKLAVPLDGSLSLQFVADTGTGRYGVGLTDSAGLTLGSGAVNATLHASPPEGWPQAGSASAVGTALYLVRLNGTSVEPALGLEVTGGVGVQRGDGSALVDAGAVRVSAVTAWVHAVLDLDGTATSAVSGLAGRVDLSGLALPLGAGPPTGSGDGNPVAAALLRPDDSSSSGSSSGPAGAPSTDLSVWTLPDDASVHVAVTGADAHAAAGQAAIWLPVHRSMGPVYLDQLGVGFDDTDVSLLVDGSLSVAGLAVGVDGLGVTVPIRTAGTLSTWKVDLQGLAVQLDTASVQLEGGLLKTTLADGSIEYDGSLRIEVAGRSISAVGAYSTGEGYTSLFVFAAALFPLGGPPFFFVEGLAGGVGINRGLVVPTDPLQVPTFPLMTRLHADANDTDLTASLRKLASSMPPQRGSYWLAAGLTFSTFELLHTDAVVYGRLAGNVVTVGLLGVCRFIQPGASQQPSAPQSPLVNVELALAAQFSTADDVLSVRAELTSNSWVISQDCQLSGGFALIAGFRHPGDFLFTIGGYRTGFSSPGLDLPTVPRVGFRWSVSSAVSVKGEAYFALVSNTVMFGGRIELSYDLGVVKAWFTAWLDALVQWDPFWLAADLGVTVGVSLDLSTNFLGVTISVTFSATLGVTVAISGPEFTGSAAFTAGPMSVTIPIGSSQPKQPHPVSWATFADAHLPAAATRWQVVSGAVSESTGTDDTPDGTKGSPFQVQPCFAIRLDSAVPTHTYTLSLLGHAGLTVAQPTTSESTAYPVDATMPAGTSLPDVSPPIDQVLTAQFAQAVTISSVGPAPVTPGGGLSSIAHSVGFPMAVWQEVPQNPPPDRALFVGGSGLELHFDGELSPAVGDDVLVTVAAASTTVSLAAPTAAAAAVQAGTTAATAEEVAEASSGGVRFTGARPGGTVPRPTGPVLASVLQPAGPGQGARVVHAADHLPGSPVRRSLPSATDLRSGGVAVEPGRTHLWRIEPWVGVPHTLSAAGTGRVRVTALTAAGVVLADVEGDAGQVDLSVPPGAARLAVAATGRRTDPNTAALSGDRSALLTRMDGVAGWRGDTSAVQVAPRTALVAGGTIQLPGQAVVRRRRSGGAAVRRARDLVAGFGSVRTTLPAGTEVVAVTVARRSAGSTGLADVFDNLDIDAGSGRLGRPVVVAAPGRTQHLLYPVRGPRDAVTVTVHGLESWLLDGVLGLPGPLPHWRDTLVAGAGLPTPGPVASPDDDGAVVVRLRAEPPEGAKR